MRIPSGRMGLGWTKVPKWQDGPRQEAGIESPRLVELAGP